MANCYRRVVALITLAPELSLRGTARGGGRTRVRRLPENWRAVVSEPAGAYNVSIATGSDVLGTARRPSRRDGVSRRSSRGGSRDPPTSCAADGERTLVGVGAAGCYRHIVRPGRATAPGHRVGGPEIGRAHV